MKPLILAILMFFVNPLISQLDTFCDQISFLQESPNGTFAFVVGSQVGNERYVVADDFEVLIGETWAVNYACVLGIVHFKS